MNLVLYQQSQQNHESFDQFLDVLYSSQMNFLASDLLEEGLNASDIRDAIKRAITVARTAQLNIRQHFAPVYTQIGGELVHDCKLSRLGYSLLLINARPDSPLVSHWQLKLIRQLETNK